MPDFIRRNLVLILILALWYIAGAAAAPLFFAIGTLTILLWWRRKMYFEILAGFFFILVLSDNLRPATDFAKVYKNAYIVILALIPVLSRSDFRPFNKLWLYFVPFVLVSFVGISDSPVAFTGFQKAVSYLLLVFAVPQFFATAFRNRGRDAARDFIFLGVLLVLAGFVLILFEPGLAFSHGGRFRGVFGNPNGLGIFAGLLLVLTVAGREYFKGLFSKNDLRWMVLPLLAAVALSGSRTSILAVGLFLLFVRFFRTSPFLGFLMFFAFGVAVEVVSTNLLAVVSALGLQDFFRIDTVSEGSGRYVAWNFAWEAIREHFWFGRGFAFDEWLMGENQDFLNALGHQGGVHNTYLIVWLNAGLVGLLLFLRAWLLIFIRAGKQNAVAFPAMFLVLFSILLEPWLAASLNPFTIILLTALVMMTDHNFQPYLREEISPGDPEEKQIPAPAQSCNGGRSSALHG